MGAGLYELSHRSLLLSNGNGLKLLSIPGKEVQGTEVLTIASNNAIPEVEYRSDVLICRVLQGKPLSNGTYSEVNLGQYILLIKLCTERWDIDG